MQIINGHCHCGNISLEITLSVPPKNIVPRHCDCDFCQKHRAEYISDPNGKINIHIKNPSDIKYEHQGSNQANFLVCNACGMLIGALYRESGHLYAAINRLTINDAIEFADPIVISPKYLSITDKVQRWKELWFNHVELR